MKIYQHQNNKKNLLILFECTANTHITVLNGYIELHKKNYPINLLDNPNCLYKEIDWCELEPVLQLDLKNYFRKSYNKALNKYYVFKESLEGIENIKKVS